MPNTPNMPWQFFLPALAEKSRDLQISWKLQQPLIPHGLVPGLMLVIRDGVNGLSSERAVQQQANLRQLAPLYGDAPIVVMLANFPLEEIDWLHHPSAAETHVQQGINFAAQLPFPGKKLVTFHLNSLCSKEEFASIPTSVWRQKFKELLPTLTKLAKEAQKKGCSLLVETVPVPEFGDISPTDNRAYQGVHLRELRNPWYLTGFWGIQEIKNAGLGIVLDLCHARALLQSLKTDAEGAGIFAEDRSLLQGRSLMDEVSLLEQTDLVHLNDGRGNWNCTGGTFEEGVALGEGDINELPQIITHLKKTGVPTVLEVNEESDYLKRPANVRSLAYLMDHLTTIG